MLLALPTADDVMIYDGVLKLLDGDNDGVYEIGIHRRTESFVVDFV
jgi:hypothetical protein